MADRDDELDDGLHGWKPRLDELAGRLADARAMGGPERVKRQHQRGRLDARQRIERLFDPGSFRELGTLVGGGEDPPIPADALVAGMGRIDGRPVLAGAEDFSVLAGSIGPGAADKRARLAQLAAQERVPLVMMLEGAGHRLTNALRRHGRAPNDLQALADLSGRVPTVCLVLGASAGHGALTAPLLDYVVMTEDASIFSAGPPLVEAALGERVEKHELGGPDVQVDASGVVHDRVADDAEAIARARRYLSHFPAHAWSPPPRREGEDTGPRRLDAILEQVPADDRRPYAIRPVLESLVDAGSLFEVQSRFGRAMVTAYAFLGGRAVALLANDPGVRAGAIDADAADKAARFLEVAGSFHLPVVFLADNPGVMAGTRSEREGILRASARLFAAQHRVRSPKLHVTLRKAFGFGSSVMAMNPFDHQTLTLAFPGATLGAMPAGSGATASGLDDETASAVASGQAGGPWAPADGMAYDEVIDPRDLRNALLDGLALAAGRDAGPLAPRSRPGVLP